MSEETNHPGYRSRVRQPRKYGPLKRASRSLKRRYRHSKSKLSLKAWARTQGELGANWFARKRAA